MTRPVIWFTGLPSSGKSTLARRVRGQLRERGLACCLLDSDELRDALVPEIGYGDAARDDFYHTLSNLAALLAGQDVIVLVAATANRRAYRERARRAVDRFIEVHLDTPLDVCRERDIKGLYAASPETLPGVGRDYEPPERADVVATGGEDDAAAARIVELCAARSTGMR